jgi:nucleotide-binding universal stress UspA family protein
MTSLRSILLHLDPSPRSVRRLELAVELCALQDARVTALYATASALQSVPFAMGDGMAEIVPMLQRLDADYRNAAKRRFDISAATTKQPFLWRALGSETVIPGVARQALCNDLLVFGQHDASDPLTAGVPSDLVPSVLMASGRPALVAPYVDVGTSLGSNVLIAWKSTRESAHAVSAAIPFLQRARHIHLTFADEGDTTTERAAALGDYLRLHGVQVPVQRHASLVSDSPGDDLLSLAADIGADLLVMGCYGHSRARELVLGGASRTVLKSMTLPVLMAH